MSIIRDILNNEPSSALYLQPTVGQVVDTNDPQQMGRLRIMCPALGDSASMRVEDIPWASYLSPFGGVNKVGSRGREDDDYTQGPVAYGMWALPKVGATAMVVCIDGDTRFRVYLGCLPGQFLTHTMPHGRFAYNPEMGDGEPAGPVSSEEEPIEPISSQLDLMFTKSQDTLSVSPPSTPKDNFEFRSRGFDNAVSKVDNEIVDSNFSSISWTADDENATFTEPDGNVITRSQGYQSSRVEPGSTNSITGDNLDSQIYSVTTPGFHAISMDDSSDNCRMRFRTTHGNQIILDDTNERIYVSTPQGDTWIELDEKGNIDIYAKRNISYHAEEDFNVTAKNIRMKADNAIHLESDNEMRVHTKSDFHLKSDTNIRQHALEEMRLQSVGNLHIDTTATAKITAATQMDIKVSGGTLFIETSAKIDAKAGSDAILEGATTANLKGATTNVESGGVLNLLGGGNVLITGAEVHANGPTAGSATPGTGATAASPTEHKEAWLTSRVPEHEPWARMMTKESSTDGDIANTHAGAGEYSYNDPLVGRTERGTDLQRNPKWHR